MTDTCQRCGAPRLTPDDAERCPRCLLTCGRAPKPPRATRGGFTAPSVDELAHRFPHLDVLELVGQGGMGAVYRCRQPRLDRLVALKVLRPESEGDPAFTQRFVREARVLAKLDHPGIVRVYDFGVEGALHWLLMEYVDGSNLREVLDAGKLPPADALALIPQACEALQFAHDHGVVHRDIKPENLLLDGHGRLRIADFGLAQLDELGSEAARLTGTYEVFGTPRYMAPEQLAGARAVDHRADIYALGAVFYELLTGELPLGRFEAPSRRSQGIDARVDEVVMRSLEREPGRRYQRASEVRAALDDIGRSAPPSAPRTRLFHEYLIGSVLTGGVLALILVGAGQRRAYWLLMGLFVPGCSIGSVLAMRAPNKYEVSLALALLIGSLCALLLPVVNWREPGWVFLGIGFLVAGIGQGHWAERQPRFDH
ncbi:MAG: serine/threonine-protein kinase [Planctomycetota bacterium]